jgi:hypothetical protein
MNVTSTLAASSPTIYQQLATDMQQLQQNLKSGNLQGAQSAYAAIAKIEAETSSSSGSTSTTSGSTNSGGNPLAAVGQALQQGNLSGAQQAFQQLQLAGHHRHHGQGASPSSSSTSNSSSPFGYQSSPIANASRQAIGGTGAGNLNISA